MFGIVNHNMVIDIELGNGSTNIGDKSWALGIG